MYSFIQLIHGWIHPFIQLSLFLFFFMFFFNFISVFPSISLSYDRSVCQCMCLSVCLTACESVCMSVSVCVYVCMSICIYICLSVCVPICLCVSFCLCIYMCVYLCIYLSMCMFVRVCVCLSMCLSLCWQVSQFISWSNKHKHLRVTSKWFHTFRTILKTKSSVTKPATGQSLWQNHNHMSANNHPTVSGLKCLNRTLSHRMLSSVQQTTQTLTAHRSASLIPLISCCIISHWKYSTRLSIFISTWKMSPQSHEKKFIAIFFRQICRLNSQSIIKIENDSNTISDTIKGDMLSAGLVFAIIRVFVPTHIDDQSWKNNGIDAITLKEFDD